MTERHPSRITGLSYLRDTCYVDISTFLHQPQGRLDDETVSNPSFTVRFICASLLPPACLLCVFCDGGGVWVQDGIREEWVELSLLESDKRV